MREAKKLGALGAFISGAGPSIVAIVYKGDRDYITRAQELCESCIRTGRPYSCAVMRSVRP